VTIVKRDRAKLDVQKTLQLNAKIAMVARSWDNFGTLKEWSVVERIEVAPSQSAWTDDYPTIVSALLRKAMAPPHTWTRTEFCRDTDVPDRSGPAWPIKRNARGQGWKSGSKENCRMRCNILAASALFAAAMLGSAPASADNYPFCSREGFGVSQDCSFETMAQCNAAVKGMGTDCFRNPRYKQPAQAAPVSQPSTGAPPHQPKRPAKRPPATKSWFRAALGQR
jgi:hypothetical protein